MESIVSSGLISEKLEQDALSYLLLSPDLISSTGYKVLQGEEREGFAPCVRVIDNGRDKLVYYIEGFRSLKEMLPTMGPDEFCVVVAGILHAFQSVRQVGFLNPANIIFNVNRVFVDPEDFSVHLIYLPVSELDTSGVDSFSEMKTMLAGAIAENANVDNEAVRMLGTLLEDIHVSPEQLHAYVGNLQLPEGLAAAAQGASLTGTSGALGTGHTAGLMSTTGSMAHSADLVDDIDGMPEQSSPEKAKKLTTRFGIGKRRVANRSEPIAEAESGTEVLDDIFVPTIVLEGIGTSKKVELLVNKQNYIIGKRGESVDGLVDFSNAVSRVHCCINHNDGKNFITDLGSANGTFLNGKKLDPEKPSILNDGDKVKMADVNFMVKGI